MYNMKFLLLLVCAISVSCRVVVDDVLEQEWKLFKHQYSKMYENALEERMRKKTFLDNKLMIIQHNELYELGQVSFELGLNEFADVHHEEFIATMNGDNSNSTDLSGLTSEAGTFLEPYFDVPSSVDWRDKGAVTPVKSQGQCGSCWAFAATGCLEGLQFIKTGQLISLSEQNLVDCSHENSGCNGGLAMSAFKFIKDNGGIDSEDSYPYEGEDDTCRYDPNSSVAQDKGFTVLKQGSEEALKKAVATIGPIAVSMDASLRSLQHYRQGVFFDPACSSTKLNHAVLVVGYGTTRKGEDYWIVKNSWDTNWGDDGYFLMARNKRNHCGLATRAVYPLV